MLKIEVSHLIANEATMKQPSAPLDVGPDSGTLYPKLPELTSSEHAQSYRLQEISQLKKKLEDEGDKRAALHKKYRRGVNAMDGVDTTLLMAGMGMGVAGIGLLSTVIAAPVVLGLEIAALACGVLGVTGKFIGRRLAVKARKHDEIRVLASSKLNTISDHVSTALVDGQISDHEFRLILDEVAKYHQMKDKIRTGARQTDAAITLDEETLVQRGRDEARADLIKKLVVE